MNECFEIAANMPRPPARLDYNEALAIINAEMPNESYTVRSNVAEALARRSWHEAAAADKAARRGYETRPEAEAAQRLQANPFNWYVWEMNDGRWHISLMTNRRP